MPPPVTTLTGDRDYRMSFNIEQLKLPPPPPPPTKQFVALHAQVEPDVVPEAASETPDSSALVTLTKSPKVSDNIESMDMDMDLSDDDFEGRLNTSHENLKLIVDGSKDAQFSLEPPPPLPDLPDDVDANNLLDDLSSDLHEFSNLSDELNNCGGSDTPTADTSNVWNQTLMPPPSMSMNFRDIIGGPPPAPHHLLNAPLPMMSAPPMVPPPMGTLAPPPVPPPSHGMMSPPPPMMMPPPPHPNWLSKEATDMLQQPVGPNEGAVPPWMNDKEQLPSPWVNDDEQWENEDIVSGK